MRVRTMVFAVLLVLPWSAAMADDVPEPARKDYQAALDLLAKGDVDKAFSAISRAKEKAPQSVDFWDAYVRIWRAAKKPEKTLWDTIIGKRREANPQSPTFDLVLARLEADPAKRAGLYDAALKKDPKSAEARLGIARLHIAAGRDDEAEQAVEAVLAEQPNSWTPPSSRRRCSSAAGRRAPRSRSPSRCSPRRSAPSCGCSSPTRSTGWLPPRTTRRSGTRRSKRRRRPSRGSRTPRPSRSSPS